MSRRLNIEKAKDALIQKYIEDLEGSARKDRDPVEDALERALEDTTPSKPGRSWNIKKEKEPESEWLI